MHKIVLWLYFIFLGTALSANDVDELKKVALSNVNALIILTSQDMLSSGRYTFSDPESSNDTSMRLYNLPLYYHFDPLFYGFNFFVNGSLGYSEFDADIEFDPTLPSDHMTYQTTALRLGGGVRYKSDYGIKVLGGFDYIYSYINNSYDYNSAYSQANYQPLLDEAFANQKSHAYTYELFFKVGYFPTWAEWKPYVEWSNNYFDTKSSLDTKELLSFKSTSVGTTLKLGFETPQFIHIYKTGISTEFFIAGNAFAGDVRDTLGFDGYGSAAVLLHLYLYSGFYGAVDEELGHIPSLLNRIDFMVESVDGDGISGYNIGLSAGFDF